ncbi:MAG: FMN-binding protein [Desulforhabdus sp.]|jgi:electron transport complex protein RnfG|nr:FMN-binding protein [Desulforhabdus sp.]
MKPLPPLDPIASSALERLKHNYILQAWLVLMLALFFGASLAVVHLRLGPRIEQYKANETRHRIPEIILGSARAEDPARQERALTSSARTISVKKQGRELLYTVYEARHPEGNLAGWVAKAAGQGYADKVELLIGFSPSVDAITGIFVLDQKETPGLGNKITTVDWRSQFAEIKTAQPVEVIKSGAKRPNQIDAITGATISSRSVTRIVNTTVEDLRGPLAALARNAKD